MPATTRKKRERSKGRKTISQRYAESTNGQTIGTNDPRGPVDVANEGSTTPENDRRFPSQQHDRARSRAVLRPTRVNDPRTRQGYERNRESAAQAYRTGEQGADEASRVAAPPHEGTGIGEPKPQQSSRFPSAFTAEIPQLLKRLGQGGVVAVNNVWKRTLGSVRR